MKHRDFIASIKGSTFDRATANKLRILTIKGEIVGSLIPVGDWILSDEIALQKITDWRLKFNRMFPTRTSVTSSSTKKHIKNSYIDNSDAIFFLIFTESDELVGHIGLCSLDKKSFELANLMRGASGGNNDLIYLAELCLVNFGFGLEDYNQCHVEIMSYNWIVSELHQKVGFVETCSSPLFKSEDSIGISHRKVEISEKNVEYTINTMSLSKDLFYSLHNFQ